MLSFERQDLEVYDARSQYLKGLENIKLVQFLAEYNFFKDKLTRRKNIVIIRTLPCYSSNPCSQTFGLFCKYHLIKYKPWINSMEKHQKH